MRVSITNAKAQLTELMRLAEAGEEVIVTRHGQPAIRFTPVKRVLSPEERGRILNAVRQDAVGKAVPGPSAARSQDFLYDDEYGLPK